MHANVVPCSFACINSLFENMNVQKTQNTKYNAYKPCGNLKNPKVEGMIVYQKGNNKLYVQGDGKLNALAEKVMILYYPFSVPWIPESSPRFLCISLDALA